jgi:hypothetical protein
VVEAVVEIPDAATRPRAITVAVGTPFETVRICASTGAVPLAVSHRLMPLRCCDLSSVNVSAIGDTMSSAGRSITLSGSITVVPIAM